jgi:hypothetical protein
VRRQTRRPAQHGVAEVPRGAQKGTGRPHAAGRRARTNRGLGSSLGAGPRSNLGAGRRETRLRRGLAPGEASAPLCFDSRYRKVAGCRAAALAPPQLAAFRIDPRCRAGRGRAISGAPSRGQPGHGLDRRGTGTMADEDGSMACRRDSPDVPGTATQGTAPLPSGKGRRKDPRSPGPRRHPRRNSPSLTSPVRIVLFRAADRPHPTPSPAAPRGRTGRSPRLRIV